MSNGDPGSFLTSSVTRGVGAVATSTVTGSAGGAFQGAWLGASVGSVIPGVGTAIGAGVGATLGAAFGTLTATSKALNRVWGNLIKVTRGLLDTYAKFEPILLAQQERWKQLDRQVGKAWANAIAPTMKRLTDIGTELTVRWTRLKLSVFKSWEEVIGVIIEALGKLAHVALGIAEFMEKLKNLIIDLIRFALWPLVEGFKALAKLLGLITPKVSEGLGGPSWKPGISPGYSDKSAAGLGGSPLLRGKFKPDMEVPSWAQEGKLEFGWWKDFKGWLGGYLDRILNALGGTVGNAALQLTDPELYKAAKAARKQNKERPFDQPLSEEELEEELGELRQRLKKQKSESKSGALLGAAGAVSRIVGMSAFTSVPDPEIHTIEPESWKITQLRELRDARWKSYVKKKGWKNYDKDSDRYKEIQVKYEAWNSVNRALEEALDEAGLGAPPVTTTAEEREAAEQRLADLKESAAKQREELKKYKGEKTTPWQARKELFDLAQEALDPDKATGVATEAEAEVEAEAEEVEDSRRYTRAGRDSGNIVMQVLDSNQLLEMLAFSWDEVRDVLRQQQAEYALVKYRMQTEGTVW